MSNTRDEGLGLEPITWEESEDGAARFDAFPELPYDAPKEWGPRISMVIPRPPSVREMVRGMA